MSFNEALEELLVQVAPFHSNWLFLESVGLGATKLFFLVNRILGQREDTTDASLNALDARRITPVLSFAIY